MEKLSFEVRGVHALSDILVKDKDNFLTIAEAELWLDKHEQLFYEHINKVFEEVDLEIEPSLYEHETPGLPFVFSGLVFPVLYYTLKFYSHLHKIKKRLYRLREHYLRLNSPIEVKYIKAEVNQTLILKNAVSLIEDDTNYFKNNSIEVFEFNPDYHTDDFPLTFIYLLPDEMEDAIAFAKLFSKHMEEPFYGIFEQQMIMQ